MRSRPHGEGFVIASEYFLGYVLCFKRSMRHQTALGDGDQMGTRLFATMRRTSTLILAALLVCGAPATGATNISFLDAFRNDSFSQTGNGNTLSPGGSFYSSDLVEVNPGGFYTSVTMTYPGAGSPVALSPTSPTNFHFQTPSFATQAAMDAAFPHGTYAFTTNNGDTASFGYAADDYALSRPYLTGT